MHPCQRSVDPVELSRATIEDRLAVAACGLSNRRSASVHASRTARMSRTASRAGGRAVVYSNSRTAARALALAVSKSRIVAAAGLTLMTASVSWTSPKSLSTIELNFAYAAQYGMAKFGSGDAAGADGASEGSFAWRRSLRRLIVPWRWGRRRGRGRRRECRVSGCTLGLASARSHDDGNHHKGGDDSRHGNQDRQNSLGGGQSLRSRHCDRGYARRPEGRNGDGMAAVRTEPRRRR